MSFKDLDEAFAWIEGFTNLERSASLFSPRTYQLDRMRVLSAASGNPQAASPTVHLAGTKGKGSTAVMIAQGLRRAGRRTGLYTSPHVSSYRERIRVLAGARGDVRADAGVDTAGPEGPPEALLLSEAEALRVLVEDLPEKARREYGPPSTFELLTLLAFRSFRTAGCDVVVVETGIGGRLDATNLVQPELTVITPIELEHTAVLGDTLEAIAREKAGILKPGVPAICAPQRPEAEAVLRATARERGCPIVFLDEELTKLRVECTPEGTQVDLRLRDGTAQQLRLSMLGAHQGENAALAFLALRRLGVAPAAAAAGCAEAILPARMELLRPRPPVVLDGAHTPRSVSRVLESFSVLFSAPAVLLFAAAEDKRIEEMAAVLAPAFRSIVITSTGSQRESRPQDVHRHFAAINPAAVLMPEPAAALERALELAAPDLPVLITGSFYLAGEVRRAWPRLAARSAGTPDRGEPARGRGETQEGVPPAPDRSAAPPRR